MSLFVNVGVLFLCEASPPHLFFFSPEKKKTLLESVGELGN